MLEGFMRRHSVALKSCAINDSMYKSHLDRAL